MIDTEALQARFQALSPHLNERARRLFVASEAHVVGRGGIAAVSEVTDVERSTIGRGLAELRSTGGVSTLCICRRGRGRKPKIETEPGLLEALPELVQSAIRGDPEAALLWAAKASVISPARWLRAALPPVKSWSDACCVVWASACKRTAKPPRARAIPTAMPNSSTSPH